VEANSEAEKGSSKVVITYPNSEPKTYSSSWYFNYNDFKTKGNTIFIIRDLLSHSSEVSDLQVNNIQWIENKILLRLWYCTVSVLWVLF
jgi:hypothetical protein